LWQSHPFWLGSPGPVFLVGAPLSDPEAKLPNFDGCVCFARWQPAQAA
jgi:hypothetical protein